MTNWIQEMTDKRRHMISTTIIPETIDPLRLDELLEKGVPVRKTDFDEKLVWNLQTGQLTDFKGEVVPTDPSQPTELHLNDKLRQDKAVLLVVKWVFSRVDTTTLTNWLLEWSQNPRILANFSTIVVFTTSLDHFPSELLRWCIGIVVPPSSEEERMAEITRTKEEIEKAMTAVGRKAVLKVGPELITGSRGLTLHDIRSAAYESFGRYREFRYEVFSEYKVKNILSAYKIRYIEPKFGFESVMGYGYLKRYLRSRILDPMVNPEKYLQDGITPPKGLLLYGPPGCGKTFISHSLAKESGLSVIEIAPADFLGSLVGQTEARVRQITETIESLAPVVVFIDEADQILMDRSRLSPELDSGARTSLVSGLLTWLGSPDRKAFVVGATNYLERIDKAFLRVGRFDKTAIMLYPDFESRIAMLQHYSKGKKVEIDADGWKTLAHETSWWNSAELSSLPVEAAYSRFEAGTPAIRLTDFDNAIRQRFRVDKTARKKEMGEMVQRYVSYAPNFEPWLLEEARTSIRESDPDIAAAFAGTV